MGKQLQIGDAAPDFTAAAQDGQTIQLSQFQGKNSVVLFFYPKNETTICTREACAFRDAYEDFVKAGAVVIGISGDSIASHQAFASNRQLPFLLLSDQDGTLRKLFTVPKTLGLLPGRVTYVIDRQGVVRHIFNAQFTADRHVKEAIEMVRTLA